MIFVPKDLKKKREHDINLLRMFYLFCEEKEVAYDDDIQRSFHHLVKWTGKVEFVDVFIQFESFVLNYIDNKKLSKNK